MKMSQVLDDFNLPAFDLPSQPTTTNVPRQVSSSSTSSSSSSSSSSTTYSSTSSSNSNIPPPPVKAKSLASSSSTPSSAKHQKKTRAKKPAGYPKRPLTAYNFFFQMVRDRLVVGDESLTFTKEQVALARNFRAIRHPSHKRTHGKIGFRELAVTIGQKWKILDPQYKALFDVRAQAERHRYDREVAQWEKAQRDACSRANRRTNETSANQTGSFHHQSFSPGAAKAAVVVEDDCHEVVQSSFRPGPIDQPSVCTLPDHVLPAAIMKEQSTSTIQLCSYHQNEFLMGPFVNQPWSSPTTQIAPSSPSDNDEAMFSDEDLAFLNNLDF